MLKVSEFLGTKMFDNKLNFSAVVRPTFKNLKVELEKTVAEGTVAEFDCEAHADPPPQITWRHVSYFKIPPSIIHATSFFRNIKLSNS